MDDVDRQQDSIAFEMQSFISNATTVSLGPRPHISDDGSVYCAHCNTKIPKARLDAIPGTGLCVNCAEKFQNGDIDF